MAMNEPTFVLVTDEERALAEQLGETLPARMPVLPLQETVVFPGTMTPLAIGQTRSLALIDDVVEGNRLLALIAIRDSDAERPGWTEIFEIGTAAFVHRMMRVPDGTVRVVVQGLKRVAIAGDVADEPYLVGELVLVPDQTVDTPELEALTRTAKDLFTRVIDFVPYLPQELQPAASLVEDPSALCHLVASTLRLEAEQQQQLLELVDVEQRLREVLLLLDHELEFAVAEASGPAGSNGKPSNGR
jgi:ATP-dependent Lon protease